MSLLTSLHNSTLGTWIRESPSIWSYPTVLTLHTVGLALLAGLSIAVDLRILGVARRVPLAPMASFFPVMWIGFWINAVSGTALFMADAERKAVNPALWTKLACVAVGCVVLRSLQRRIGREPISHDGQLDVSRTTTVLAAVSLVTWLAAIASGRLIAYFEIG